MPRLAASAADVRALSVRYNRPNGSPTLRFLVLVGGLSIFGPLCIDMYLPALPKITENLHASASAVQFSLTTCLVGIGCGQLVYGTVSDRLGRRRPLLVGLGVFVVASLCCSIAPNATLLALLRFFQGLGGAAGIVISRAIVRDLFEGVNAAKVFSMLMLVTGLGPVLAPQIGAELLVLTSWRGVFVTLAVAGSALLVVAAVRIPETLSGDLRTEAGFGTVVRTMRRVGTSLSFLQNALSASLGFGAVFAYVAGAAFVFENVYHATPQQFGLLFAMNAVGLIAASQVNAHIVGRFGAERIMTRGLAGMAVSTALLLIVVTTRFGGITAVLICMFAAMSSNGFIGPNAIALSLQDFPDVAGSASALLGLSQFGLGAVIAPIVGLGGSHDAFPMALAMASLGVGGLLVRLLLMRRSASVHEDRLVAANCLTPKPLEID